MRQSLLPRSQSARRRRGRIQRRRSTGSRPPSHSGTTARGRQNATRWALPREVRLPEASGYHHRVQGALFVLGGVSAEGRGARITYLVCPGPPDLDIAQRGIDKHMSILTTRPNYPIYFWFAPAQLLALAVAAARCTCGLSQRLRARPGPW